MSKINGEDLTTEIKIKDTLPLEGGLPHKVIYFDIFYKDKITPVCEADVLISPPIKKDGKIINICKIDYIDILSNFQNKGVGSYLINEIEKTVKELGIKKLEVISSQSAIGFYLKNGFKENETDKQFFEKELI
jgi:GNAT superfamily N-acetyltransferase